MIVFPNAKINLGLNVVQKRDDGFHDIETIFLPVQWNDILEIVPRDDKEIHFSFSGLPVDCPPGKNLVAKAYALMKERYGLPGVDIHLHKKIPFGGGLGGGSSDAANTLLLAARLFDLSIEEQELMELALKIGSDCPFFLKNTPAFAKGRGEKLSPVNIDLKGYFLVVQVPPVPVSTKEAYQSIVPAKPDKSLLKLVEYPVKEWKSLIKNDFEGPVFTKYPAIQQVKNQFYQRGAVYASMSGSGSAVFGLFHAPPAIPFSPGVKQWGGWL
jgi:4-diphosphocytidyl-2-C-methyl-D-erythritol kinase